MLFYNNFYDIAVISYVYLHVYNVSLILVFWTFQQFISFNFKTIYSFNDFKFNPYLAALIAITLFSMAGVPPFIGFFTKLLILILLLNSTFFVFYSFFFILLFIGLYFYLQNIRFLYSVGYNNIEFSHLNNVRVSINYIYFSHLVLFFLTFGFLLIDDVFLYFYWLLA